MQLYIGLKCAAIIFHTAIILYAIICWHTKSLAASTVKALTYNVYLYSNFTTSPRLLQYCFNFCGSGAPLKCLPLSNFCSHERETPPFFAAFSLVNPLNSLTVRKCLPSALMSKSLNKLPCKIITSI